MTVKPEDVGLSSARLDRIRGHFQRYIDDGKLAGTLTLVARRGEVAYFEPQGHLELERRRPMQRDTVFRIYSMSKPITTVALMMLVERGLCQLDDPVHRFIPAWEGLRVFVGGNYPTFLTAPADRPHDPPRPAQPHLRPDLRLHGAHQRRYRLPQPAHRG